MLKSGFKCLLFTVESDAHIWNLVYLQKFLEEQGAEVVNLGSCTPSELILDEIPSFDPDLLVLSSVNGHGYHGSCVLRSKFRDRGIETPCVAGGKLTTSESDNDWVRNDLMDRGFTDVFLGDNAIPKFREFLRFTRLHSVSSWTPEPMVFAPWDGESLTRTE